MSYNARATELASGIFKWQKNTGCLRPGIWAPEDLQKLLVCAEMSVCVPQLIQYLFLR